MSLPALKGAAGGHLRNPRGRGQLSPRRILSDRPEMARPPTDRTTWADVIEDPGNAATNVAAGPTEPMA